MKLSEKILSQMREENNKLLEEKSSYILTNSKKLNIAPELEMFHKNNFNYVTSYLRSKLMFEFLSYNPKLHHYKIKKAGEVFPEIKRDYEELDSQLDYDLKEILDKKRNTKRYLDIKEKHRLERLKNEENSIKQSTKNVKFDFSVINTTQANTEENNLNTESNTKKHRKRNSIIKENKLSIFKNKTEKKKKKVKDDEGISYIIIYFSYNT
jgi:hypothetical protein